MPGLSFDDKVVLTLYKKFFGENYPAPEELAHGGAPENLTDGHVKAQKMCYLLDLSGLRVGGYTYSWNTYGSFSPGLQAQLRRLDRLPADVSAYYGQDLSDSVLFANEGDENIFWAEDQRCIHSLIAALCIPQNSGEARRWIELLGSMAYISQNVFPHGEFEWVCDELVRRKPQYSNQEENRRAWDVLYSANLLSVH